MTEKQLLINNLLYKIKHERSTEAIEDLYSVLSPAIRHISLKYVHDADLADDLVQDFWADIYSIADKFIPFGNGQSYLCKIAKNKAINRYTKLKKERARIIYVDYSELQISYDDNDRDLILSVNTAISRLTDTEKIIIQSTYFEDKTVREIAIEIKMSKSAVQRHKENALKKLKQYLMEKEESLK